MSGDNFKLVDLYRQLHGITKRTYDELVAYKHIVVLLLSAGVRDAGQTRD